MPKNKTHSGTAKRVRVTGSGKLRRQHTNRRHQLEHKPSTPHPAAGRHDRDRPRGRQARQASCSVADRPDPPRRPDDPGGA